MTWPISFIHEPEQRKTYNITSHITTTATTHFTLGIKCSRTRVFSVHPNKLGTLATKSTHKLFTFKNDPFCPEYKTAIHPLLLWMKVYAYIRASSWDYGTYHIGDQRWLRRPCASAQSRQSLRCSHTWSIEVDEGSNQNSDIYRHWMAVHARLKEEFMEDEKCHNLMRWLILELQHNKTSKMTCVPSLISLHS